MVAGSHRCSSMPHLGAFPKQIAFATKSACLHHARSFTKSVKKSCCFFGFFQILPWHVSVDWLNRPHSDSRPSGLHTSLHRRAGDFHPVLAVFIFGFLVSTGSESVFLWNAMNLKMNVRWYKWHRFASMLSFRCFCFGNFLDMAQVIHHSWITSSTYFGSGSGGAGEDV